MHIFITPATLTTCQKCKAPVRPHTVCAQCGYYKGREFVNVLGAMTKKERKAKEKHIHNVEKEQRKEAQSQQETSKK
jgi:ribosomal protein L32